MPKGPKGQKRPADVPSVKKAIVRRDGGTIRKLFPLPLPSISLVVGATGAASAQDVQTQTQKNKGPVRLPSAIPAKESYDSAIKKWSWVRSLPATSNPTRSGRK